MADNLESQAQVLHDREAAQTFDQLTTMIPVAAEDLDGSRVAALHDAASLAQQQIGGMPELTPVKLKGGEKLDRLPPEVAVPVMGLFSAFGAPEAPEGLRAYQADWAALAMTNDGLLELTMLLRRAARDPTLRMAVTADAEPQLDQGPSQMDVRSSMEGLAATGGEDVRLKLALAEELLAAGRTTEAADIVAQIGGQA